jgi:pectate lyase
MHHNWYADNVIERMPRVRYGQVHVYNNYYTSKRTNYVVGVGVEAQILFEACYLDNQKGVTWYNWYEPNKCPADLNCGPGKIQWTTDNIFAGSDIVTSGVPNSQVFKPPYEYQLDKTADIPRIVSAGAGVTGGGVFIADNGLAEKVSTSANLLYVTASRSSLDFHLSKASDITITLYDNMGKKIVDVANGLKNAGSHSINLERYGISKGVYYADCRMNTFRQQVKIANY